MTIEQIQILDNDVWALMANAIKTKNIALVEKNLHRLYAVQKELFKFVNDSEWKIQYYKTRLEYETQKNYTIERQEISEKAKSIDKLREAIENTGKYFTEITSEEKEKLKKIDEIIKLAENALKTDK